MTPESLTQDEARGWVSFLLDRVATEAELRDRLARDPTRSPAVRAAARELVPGSWAMRVRRRAEAIVGPQFDRLLLRDDVLAALQAEPATDPEIQAACWKLAETWVESPRECDKAGWDLVRYPGRSAANYQRGLRLAQAACRLEPDDGSYLNTLGVAQYRLGLMAEALATLTRSKVLRKSGGPFAPAFLAMAHQRLGQPTEARAKLDQLRELIRQWQEDKRMGDFPLAEDKEQLAEAEAVVLYDPVFPEDPFAP